jgi:uncharacterized membrane protein
MCVSTPLVPEEPASQRLGIGNKGYWWSAEAAIDANTPDVIDLPAGLEGRVSLALQAGFGHDGEIADGEQIALGRVKVQFGVPADGTYTITHPYGIEVLENVTAATGIDFTRELGIIDARDPDGSFVGALYSDIGPTFLTWPGYQADSSLQTGGNQYIGDPDVLHDVTGSRFIPEGETEPANYVRIQGPDDIDVRTFLFAVSGKVFTAPAIPAQLCTFRSGKWFIDNGNGIWEKSIDVLHRNFGRIGDLPVTGDWNGDGITDIGFYRDGKWRLDTNGNGVRDAGDTLVDNFGRAGDQPLSGDWNHDGIAEIGVFRGGKWLLDSNGNGSYEPGIDARYQGIGRLGDVPLICGDGSVERGIRGPLGDNGPPVADIPFQAVTPPSLADGFSAALSINRAGLAVGIAEDTGGFLKAVSWQAQTVTQLDPLAGFDYSAAYGVNDPGVVVGESENGGFVTATYWPAGSTSAVALSTTGLFDGNSSAYAINSHDGIVGEGTGSSEGNTVAVYWENPAATPTVLPDLIAAGSSAAYDLSENGIIVGSSLNDDGAMQAVLWRPGAGGSYAQPLPLTKLAANQVASVAWGIDEGGRVVGEVQLADGTVHGAVWQLNAQHTAVLFIRDLGDGTSVQAINNSNRIVGIRLPGSGGDTAVIWNGANFNDSQVLAGPFSQAYGINAGNRVVGVAGDQAFIAEPQQ